MATILNNVDWSELYARLTTLQYPVPAPATPDSFAGYSYYSTGPLDGFMVVTIIAIMAILRDAIRIYLLEPFARWKLHRNFQLKMRKQAASKSSSSGNGNPLANGNGHPKSDHANGHVTIRSPTKKELRHMNRSVLRFAEQGWAFISYTVIWCYGLWIYRNVPTNVLNPLHVWVNYPHMPLAAPIKLYYVIQFAFYVHQVLILNAEARRKDHIQMMAHHVVTISLLLMSYFYGYTRCGCLVLVVMDTVDIILPFAKMLKYLNFSTICDIAFGAFLVTWFITRHILFNLIIISVYKDMLVYMPLGWYPERGYYVTFEIWAGFVIFLSLLQIIQLVWFRLICRVAWRVISGKGAEDARSDDEDSDADAKES